MTSRKIVLAKGRVAITPGHHKVDEPTLPRVACVHHFKWSAGVVERTRQTYERYKNQQRKWAIHSLPKLLRLIEQGVNLRSPKLRVHAAAKLGI